MTLLEIDNLIKEKFGKPLHVELDIVLPKEQYTIEFMDYFYKRLHKKSIKLEHLINSPIDNNRWIVDENCSLILLSIPIKTTVLKSFACLKFDLCKYLSEIDFHKINSFFYVINDKCGVELSELYASLLNYNTHHKIKKNVNELTNACYVEDVSYMSNWM
jgi:hypothetical protein